MREKVILILSAVTLAVLSVIMPETVLLFAIVVGICIALRYGHPKDRKFLIYLFLISLLIWAFSALLIHIWCSYYTMEGFFSGDERLV